MNEPALLIWNKVNNKEATNKEVAFLIKDKSIVLDYSISDDYKVGLVFVKIIGDAAKMFEIRTVPDQS